MSKIISDYHFEHKNNKVQVFHKRQFEKEFDTMRQAIQYITAP